MLESPTEENISILQLNRIYINRLHFHLCEL